MDEAHDVPANGETLAEHREHCDAKPGNCPFEKKAKAILESEDRTDRHEGRYVGKGDESEGVRKYTTKAKKEGSKWYEQRTDESGKSLVDRHDSWGYRKTHKEKRKNPETKRMHTVTVVSRWDSLPDITKPKETPNFDSFADVDAIPKALLSEMYDEAFPDIAERLSEEE